MEQLITSIESVIRNYHNVLAELRTAEKCAGEPDLSDLSDILDQIGEAVDILERVTEDAR